MASSYTPNKTIEKPANGDAVDTWSTPVNLDWDIIDQAFGGVTSLTATSGSVVLTVAQYRSLSLSISGVMTGNVIYTLPIVGSGLVAGGQWIVSNTTTDSGSTGPWTVTIASAAGGTSVVIPRNKPLIISSDGTNIRSVYAEAAGGVITSVTATAPITSTGGLTPNIALTTPVTAAYGGTGLSAVGTSGNVLTSNGSAWVSSAAASSVSSIQAFTSDGTFTIPAGVTKVKVTVVGGGGGGTTATQSTGQGGGGAGGAAIKVITGLTPGGTVAVTVGLGGAAETAGSTSSFGAYCSATGGARAAVRTNNVGPGGAGGTGTGGDINFTGGAGSGGSGVINVVAGVGGTGGNSIFGGGGLGGLGVNGGSAGAGGPNTGGGGAGGNSANSSPNAGGAGGSGIVIVEY